MSSLSHKVQQGQGGLRVTTRRAQTCFLGLRMRLGIRDSRSRKGPWTAAGATPHAHLGRQSWGVDPPTAHSHAGCSCPRTQVPWCGEWPWKRRLLQHILVGNRTPWCPATLGGLHQWHWGGRRSLGDGWGRWGTHLSLVGGQILSSQQVALNQVDAVIHRGANEDGQRDGLHSTHLPAAPVHDGHYEAHNACRGQGGSLDLAPPIQSWRGAGQIQRVSVEGDEVYSRSRSSGDRRDEEGQGQRGA